MLCNKCKTEFFSENCPNCGNSAKQQLDSLYFHQLIIQQKAQKKKKNALILVGAVLGVLVLGFLFSNEELFNQLYENNSKVSNNGYTMDEYILECETVDYQALVRNPKEYEGKNLAVTGKISQYISGNALTEEAFSLYEDYDYKFSKTKDECRWYISYEQPVTKRILEDDLVTFYGNFVGMVDLNLAIGGSKVTMPKMTALYHEFHDYDLLLEKVQGLSRNNPLNINETALVLDPWGENGSITFEIELTKSITGEEALNMLNQIDYFESDKSTEKEYLILEFRFKVTKAAANDSLDINSYLFSAFSNRGIQYEDQYFRDAIKPSLNTEILNGGEYFGYKVFLVDKTDSNPLVVFAKDTEKERWFKLRQ